MNRLKVSLIIFVVLTLSSCFETTRQKMLVNLSNDDFKYWFRYHNDTSRRYSNGVCIYKNGTFIDFENPTGDYSKRQVYRHPTLSKPIWRFVDDSTIMFGEGEYYRIIALTTDSLILQNLKFKSRDYLKYHREEDQSTQLK